VIKVDRRNQRSELFAQLEHRMVTAFDTQNIEDLELGQSLRLS